MYSLLESIRVIKIKEDETDGACSTCRRQEKFVLGFGEET